MLSRNLTPRLLEALSDRPVVVLNGARQTGKSTLVASLGDRHPARYLTLDDTSVAAAIAGDPAGFLAGLDGPVILDEIQRAPDLFLPLKAAVDRDRRPGRFLLTGSANVLLLPRLSESLAGRMEILTLWPLSQGEIHGRRDGFLDFLFAPGAKLPDASGIERQDLLARVATGGFPEVVEMRPTRRFTWFRSYLTAILGRDVRDLANIEGLSLLPDLLSLLAARSASLLNFAELSRSSGLAMTTLKRYFTLLEALFLVQTVPAWSNNLSKRLVKSPKLYLNDTGLLAYLLGVTDGRLQEEPRILGPVLENFVALELCKQVSWSERPPTLYHYRTQAGSEVDFLLEGSDGRIAAVEVKAASAVTARDVQPMRELAADLGDRFVRGVVIYAGTTAVPFGPRIHALPIDSLWAGE